MRSGWSQNNIACLVGLIFFGFVLSGCATGIFRSPSLEVVAVPNRETADISAETVVEVLLRTGFSEDDIVEIGPDFRNAIALAGRAEIWRENTTVAIYLVDNNRLHVSSMTVGSFIHDLSAEEPEPPELD